MQKRQIKAFQSPSNRVKCSDRRRTLISGWRVTILFQSPSNRVKCSDMQQLEQPTGNNRINMGFNPLVIGSSVLI